MSFDQNAGWRLRADAGALAVALGPVGGHIHVAVWDLQSGVTEWLTPDEPEVTRSTPIWSFDGSLLYYASTCGTTDLGIWRIRADGTQNTLIR